MLLSVCCMLTNFINMRQTA
ncbi:hypothetical protein Goari_009066 [Gossypium aridum]|uniref:Uncharacterized protein n=1 Tax=Gossypium aridum TaxID=34290 RepID=A0A7J8XXG6_GOSAI|nr:hypothetical protein [Gossypium aridum]